MPNTGMHPPPQKAGRRVMPGRYADPDDSGARRARTMNRLLVSSQAVVLTGVMALLLSGCAAHLNPVQGNGDAGFWMGTWHGFIAPFTLVVSLFTDVGIYEVENIGFWYNTGFLTGLALMFGIIGTVTEGVGAVLVLLGALGVTLLRGIFDLAVLIWVLANKSG